MKIAIVGNAVVVTSELRLEDIQLLEKYKPEALIVRGGEDGKEPMFRIASTVAAGNINDYGASFNGVTRDGSGKATVTLGLPVVEGGVDELRSVVADALGEAVLYIQKLESELPAVIEDVKAKRAALMESITIV